jgi:hypothetical protein
VLFRSWLLHIRHNLGDRIHFWPFDGWDIPEGRSVIAESYPALWSKDFPIEDRTQDQHDAFSIAAWVSRADHLEGLASLFTPKLSQADQATARIEGWILGV